MFGLGLFELIIILMGSGLLLLAAVAVLLVVLSMKPNQGVEGTQAMPGPKTLQPPYGKHDG